MTTERVYCNPPIIQSFFHKEMAEYTKLLWEGAGCKTVSEPRYNNDSEKWSITISQEEYYDRVR